MKWSIHKRRVFQLGIWLVLAWLAAWLGGRELSVGADTPSYARFYAERVACKCLGSKEVGFEVLGLIPAYLGFSQQGFFILVAVLMFGLTLHIANRVASGVLSIDPLKEWRLYLGAFVCVLGTLFLNPLYTQSHINALRHGLASLALILFVIELSQRRYAWSILWAAISVAFHLSALLHLPFVLAVMFTKGRKPLAIAWTTTLFLGLYLLGVTDDLTRYVSPSLYSFVDDYGSHALARYRTGVRADFALFTYFIAMGSLMSLRMPSLHASPSARMLAEAACLSSIPFYMLGWGVFSNRYLFSSWLMFSVVVGIAASGLVSRRAVPVSAAWGLFSVSLTAFVYQIFRG